MNHRTEKKTENFFLLRNGQTLSKLYAKTVDNLTRRYDGFETNEETINGSSSIKHKIKVITLPNAEASSPYQFPKGNVIVVDHRMPLILDVINRRPISVIVTQKINDEQNQYSDEYYLSKLNRLNEDIDQYSENPPKLFVRSSNNKKEEEEEENHFSKNVKSDERISEKKINQIETEKIRQQRRCDKLSFFLKKETGKDSDHWKAELGSNGIAGIYKSPTGKRNKYDYHIFVYCDATRPSKEYYGYIKSRLESSSIDSKLKTENDDDESTNGGSFYDEDDVRFNFPKTFGELVDSPLYDRIKEITIRNACRLLYQVADTMELKINHKMDEKSWYTGSEYFYPPMIAIPDSIQINNALEKQIDEEGDEVVVAFNMALNPFDGSVTTKKKNPSNRFDENTLSNKEDFFTKNKVFVLLNPEEGIIELEMIDKKDKFHRAFPFCLGKIEKGEYSKKNDERRFKTDREKSTGIDTEKNYAWEITDEYEEENKNHPKLKSDVYYEPDGEFFGLCYELGWNKNGRNNKKEFFPIACKISNGHF